MALSMDDFDGMSEEEIMKFFQDIFMSDISDAKDANCLED